MGKRLRGVSAMQTSNENPVIADLVGSTRYLWTTTKSAGPRRQGWGDIPGEPRRTEVREAGGATRLSKVEAVPVVQRVEQVCEGGWKGDAGESAGHILRRNTSYVNQIVQSLFTTRKMSMQNSNR
jgi:hypothetical protein